MEEITIEAGMKKDCITQGEADITSKQSEHARNTENTTAQRRISAKMRKETLEAYKQTFLIPIKLSDRKAPYLRVGKHRSVPTSSCAGWTTETAPFKFRRKHYLPTFGEIR